jgi:predicted transcriptional regulator
MEKVNVTCRLDKEVVGFLDDFGKQVDRDRTYLIKQALAEFRERRLWQLQTVVKAEAAYRVGDFLTEEEFLKDMESWGE